MKEFVVALTISECNYLLSKGYNLFKVDRNKKDRKRAIYLFKNIKGCQEILDGYREEKRNWKHMFES